jgi:phosphoadenosine phosphosulfate reductase
MAAGMSVAAQREASARTVLGDALREHRGKIALACSFGGAGGMVLVDLLASIDRSVPVYFLDTGLLFAETYALVARTRERYGIDPIAVRPAYSVAEQAQLFGDELWARDPDACCDLRKVAPNRRFLADYDAWISGLRREQSATREDVTFRDVNENGKIRFAPLADWTQADVDAYVAVHDVPYNELNDRGYPSVGCTYCTRAVAPGEDPRAARWPGFVKTECGLHEGARRAVKA